MQIVAYVFGIAVKVVILPPHMGTLLSDYSFGEKGGKWLTNAYMLLGERIIHSSFGDLGWRSEIIGVLHLVSLAVFPTDLEFVTETKEAP